jgi:hypothetical protein
LGGHSVTEHTNTVLAAFGGTRVRASHANSTAAIPETRSMLRRIKDRRVREV